jgi:pimeloyl-ACP methyl ester carboxylesterase
MARLLFARTPWPFWLVARDFARIAGVRVEVLQRCGHIPQLERPARTRRAVAEFFRSLGR